MTSHSTRRKFRYASFTAVNLAVNISIENNYMKIREASEKDAIQIKELVVGLSHFYLSVNEKVLPEWFSSALELKEFEGRLRSKEFTNLVCESNGNIIGYISIKDKSHIYHLFVSQEHQRKGIARTLWGKALKTCCSSKYTVRSSLCAVPVYEAFGFITTAKMEIKDNLQFQAMETNISCSQGIGPVRYRSQVCRK